MTHMSNKRQAEKRKEAYDTTSAWIEQIQEKGEWEAKGGIEHTSTGMWNMC